MASVFKLVAGNTAPTYALTLERDNGDGTTSVINLTGCTVVLIIKGKTITNAAATCTIASPATAGVIHFVPLATDFPTSGTYKADAKITYADSSVEIVYQQAIFRPRNKLS